MNNKTKYHRLLMAVLSNPDPPLFLIVAILGIFWAISGYRTQDQKCWTGTKAKLVDIELSDRVRNKKNENYYKLTYEYVGDKQKYEAYSEEILFSEFEADTKKAELYKTHDLVTIYYNDNDPEETAFDLEEVKADDDLLFLIIPIMLVVIALCYWSLKSSYNEFLES